MVGRFPQTYKRDRGRWKGETRCLFYYDEDHVKEDAIALEELKERKVREEGKEGWEMVHKLIHSVAMYVNYSTASVFLNNSSLYRGLEIYVERRNAMRTIPWARYRWGSGLLSLGIINVKTQCNRGVYFAMGIIPSYRLDGFTVSEIS